MSTSTTFSRQSKLPRLPVPRLENTLSLWRQHLDPVTEPVDASKVDAIVRDFSQGLAPALHGRLKELEKDLAARCRPELMNDLVLPTPPAGTPGTISPYSWLEDIWYKYAYLYGRDPLPIALSWWGLFRAHPSQGKLEALPLDHALGFPRPAHPDYRQGVTDHSARGRGEFTEFQLERAAGFVSNLATYYERLVAGSIPPDGTDQVPICMNQMRMIYGISRVPTTMGYDVLKAPASKEDPRFAVILVKGLVYKMSLYDEITGRRWNLATLQSQLAAAVQDAMQVHDKLPHVGVLTGIGRDIWGRGRDELRRLSSRNKEAIDTIECALFCIALEDFSVGLSTSKRGEIMACGIDGTNRWFDKCITVVVLADGTVGCNVEHSPADAVNQCYPLMYALDHEPAQDAAHCLPATNVAGGAIPRRLDFDLNTNLQQLLADARLKLRSMCNTVSYEVVEFRTYGLKAMKEFGVNADAWVQMALQLTYYKLHNRFGTTYETAGTRNFLHGRTDTMRPLTREATEWVKAVVNRASEVDQMRFLSKASKRHVSLMKRASSGQGCDRHLLALKALMKPGESSEFFSSPLTSPFGGAISQWRLSTSPLPPGFWKYFIATGFGNLTEDVYGINYMMAPHLLRFSIEAHKASMNANVRAYHLELRATLRDMRRVCLKAKQLENGTIMRNPKTKVEDEGAGLPYPYVAKL